MKPVASLPWISGRNPELESLLQEHRSSEGSIYYKEQYTRLSSFVDYGCMPCVCTDEVTQGNAVDYL